MRTQKSHIVRFLLSSSSLFPLPSSLFHYPIPSSFIIPIARIEGNRSLMASASLKSEVSSSDNNQHQGGVNGEELINSDMTPLQKHVAFFDRNKDGIVYPWETYKGFRAIGCGIPLSTVSALVINTALSQKTRPGKFPSLLFPIEVKNIHRAKHGSDSGVYDSEGRFVPSKFEEIFKKHALTNQDALTAEELSAMLKANRMPKNYMGWAASWAEWKVLYNLCKDKDGLLCKETIIAVYDGSLFEQMEKDRASTQKTVQLN